MARRDLLDTSDKIRAALEDSSSGNGEGRWVLSSTEEDSEYEPNQQDANLWDEEKREEHALYPNLTTSAAEEDTQPDDDEDQYTTEGGGDASGTLSAAEAFGRAGSSRRSSGGIGPDHSAHSSSSHPTTGTVPILLSPV